MLKDVDAYLKNSKENFEVDTLKVEIDGDFVRDDDLVELDDISDKVAYMARNIAIIVKGKPNSIVEVPINNQSVRAKKQSIKLKSC